MIAISSCNSLTLGIWVFKTYHTSCIWRSIIKKLI